MTIKIKDNEQDRLESVRNGMGKIYGGFKSNKKTTRSLPAKFSELPKIRKTLVAILKLVVVADLLILSLFILSLIKWY
jgi:hypothetical protein